MKKKILAMLAVLFVVTSIFAVATVCAEDLDTSISGEDVLDASILGAAPVIPPVTDPSTLPPPTFTMSGDAGYYADSRTSTPDSGDIVFDVRFRQAQDYAGYAGFTQYGVFIYNTSEQNPVKADIKSKDKATLYTYKGYYNATVTGIKPEYFDSVVVAVPYIILDGNIVTGTPFSYTVYDGDKWLGKR